MKQSLTPKTIILFSIGIIALLMWFLGSIFPYCINFLSGVVCLFICTGFSFLTVIAHFFTGSFEKMSDVMFFIAFFIAFISSMVQGIIICVTVG